MTREEFMDIVYGELHSDGDNNRANRIIDAFDLYVDEVKPHWIPCSERMPEEEKCYLVTDCGGGISDVAIDELAHYEDSGEPFWLYSPNKVTAWMPLLVEPYTEDKA